MPMPAYPHNPGPRIVLCVPGVWKDRREITAQIARRRGDYLFAGVVLLHINSKELYEVEVQAADERIPEAFAAASGIRLDSGTQLLLEQHGLVMYVFSSGVGMDAARRMLDVGRALLDAGGIAIKVESAGIAHSADDWRKIAARGAVGDLYRSYVAHVGSAGSWFSCGMHNLGFPDCETENESDDAQAIDLISIFNFYQLVDRPVLRTGETFSASQEAPIYRLTHREADYYPPGDFFHNPFGVWRLSPA